MKAISKEGRFPEPLCPGAVPADPRELARILFEESFPLPDLLRSLGTPLVDADQVEQAPLPPHPQAERLPLEVLRAARRVTALWGPEAACRAMDFQARESECLRALESLRLQWLAEFHEACGRILRGQDPGGFVPGFRLRWREFREGHATLRNVLRLWMYRLEVCSKDCLPDPQTFSVQAVEELCTAWAGARANLEPAWRRAALAWTLALPAATHVPVACPRRLACLAPLLAEIPWERLAPHLDVFTTLPGYEEVVRIFNSGLPSEVVGRALRLGVLGVARLARTPRRALVTLTLSENVRALDLPEVEPHAPWIAELTRRGRDARYAVALRHLAGGQREGLDGVAEALGVEELRSSLDGWSRVTVHCPPAELEGLSALGLPSGELEACVHHRRLAGLGETLPGPLLRLLRQPARELQEVEYLQRVEVPGGARRLARLLDPEQAGQRRRREAWRAARHLESALEVLRRQSLEAVLSSCTVRLLERLLGSPVGPGRLPSGWLKAFLLLDLGDLDLGLWLGFLRDLAQGRSLSFRPANLRWLERARANGVEVEAWQRGFQVEVEVRGERVRIATESEPIEVLQMGSHFKTCLSLEGGFNALGALMCALDVNKQVVYARDRGGRVLARKLIAANARGSLLAYKTYAHLDLTAIDVAMTRALGDFACACRLRLRPAGRSEALHKGSWYEDEPVSCEEPARPEPGPCEEAYCRAVRGQDIEALDRLRQPGGPTAASATFRWHLAGPASRPVDSLDVLGARRLIAAGRVEWLRSFPTSRQGTRELLAALPFDPEVAGRAVRILGEGRAVWPAGALAPASLALAPGRELLWMLGRADLPAEVPGLGSILHAVYKRERQPALLWRALRSPVPALQAAAAHVLRWERLYGCEAALWRLAPRHPEAWLALAWQDPVGSRERLYREFVAHPGLLELAVAALRCWAHEPDRCGRIRDTFEPSSDDWPGHSLPPADRLALARELASPRLAALIRSGLYRDLEHGALRLAVLGDRGQPPESGFQMRAMWQAACQLASALASRDLDRVQACVAPFESYGYPLTDERVDRFLLSDPTPRALAAWVGAGQAPLRAGLWLAVGGDAGSLPEPVRRVVGRLVLEQAVDPAELSVAARWLRGVPCEVGVAWGEWPLHDVWGALENPDPGVALLGQVNLRLRLERGALGLAELERAAWELHPDRYEADLPEWLSRLDPGRLSGEAVAAALCGPQVSRRFQQGVLEHLWPRLSPAVRAEARARLERERGQARVAWMLSLVG